MSDDLKLYKLVEEYSSSSGYYEGKFLVWIPYRRLEDFINGIAEIFGEYLDEYPPGAVLRRHGVCFDLNEFNFPNIDLWEVFSEEYED
ncbi:hypothetical protein LQZ18_04120 [Lachnospiraceae bacterium ZAX-1]